MWSFISNTLLLLLSSVKNILGELCTTTGLDGGKLSLEHDYYDDYDGDDHIKFLLGSFHHIITSCRSSHHTIVIVIVIMHQNITITPSSRQFTNSSKYILSCVFYAHRQNLNVRLLFRSLLWNSTDTDTCTLHQETKTAFHLLFIPLSFLLLST